VTHLSSPICAKQVQSVSHDQNSSPNRLVLGKASLSEWSDFRGGFKGGHSWGWSAIAGQCSSAYVKNASPGTSSSGTGVGVSAGFAAAGLGTDTAGSIVSSSSSVFEVQANALTVTTCEPSFAVWLATYTGSR
jgi:hypothetical protein